jgi:hypothetical protein
MEIEEKNMGQNYANFLRDLKRTITMTEKMAQKLLILNF